MFNSDYFLIDNIGKRLTPVYQGLRSVAGLVPQLGNEDSFVGIYASNSLCKCLKSFMLMLTD